jgi:diaminopimelate decarboxylase
MGEQAIPEWKLQFARAIASGDLVNDDNVVVMGYDFHIIREQARQLKAAFPSETLHAFAVKASPVRVRCRKAMASVVRVLKY